MRIVDPDMLARFRAARRCEWCGRATPQGCDPHHFWFKRGMGGGSRLDHPWNLIALCRGWHRGEWASCHDQAEAGAITKWDLLAKVAAREGRMQDTIIEELNRLRRMHKYGQRDVGAVAESVPEGAHSPLLEA